MNKKLICPRCKGVKTEAAKRCRSCYASKPSKSGYGVSRSLLYKEKYHTRKNKC